MNEQANTQVVKDTYAAFGRGDIQSILDVLSDDVEWEAVIGAGSRIPVGGLRRGRNEVATFFQTLGETLEFPTFEPREFIAQGDKVVALGHYHGAVKGTGRSFETEWAMVFTLKNGKIARFREYTDSYGIVAAFTSPAVAM